MQTLSHRWQGACCSTLGNAKSGTYCLEAIVAALVGPLLGLLAFGFDGAFGDRLLLLSVVLVLL